MSDNSSELPARRYCVTEQVGPFSVSVGFVRGNLGEWDVPAEVFITARGKSGTELEAHLYAIGVAASKIMQREG